MAETVKLMQLSIGGCSLCRSLATPSPAFSSSPDSWRAEVHAIYHRARAASLVAYLSSSGFQARSQGKPPSEVILVGAEPKDSAIRNPIYNSRVITMRNINSLGLLSQNCKAKQTKPNVTCRELQLRLFWIPSFR